MRSTATIALLLLIGMAVPRPGWAAEPDTYLFDVLRHGQYKLAFIKLFKDKSVPDWVMAVVKAGEGVATPSKTVEVGGKAFRLDHVCKVHDCAGNVLAVLWSPAGQKVWAALVDAGAPPVFFGQPSPEETETLLAAAKSG